MQFSTIEELVQLAESQGQAIADIMIEEEALATGVPKEKIISRMFQHLDTMEKAVQRGLTEEIRSRSGLTGGDARKLEGYLRQGRTLSGQRVLQAVSRAIATNEVNAAMGTIVATPTAGASGVIPGCLFGLAGELGADRDAMARFLFTSGAIGYVIANRSFISGAAGGCQAEVGSASAMAAGAIVEMAGGKPRQSAHAVAIALKNTLGLVCDPVAGLVEVPCVMRNAMGASNAIVSADLALAGIESIIPADEVIGAMYRIGQAMPGTLKETALGGLAATPTGERHRRRLFGSSNERSEEKGDIQDE
ncbi:L-serine ammonia-lyase, iron-sulfur-dependent, subunit alpha [Paenibacillus woosongensis]|uniref:L-serine dehydratase n=1 Tax=Paenibacillus woosongensis TaxID=307580 RepID=A0A7X3CNB4_9BACL|nr:L-serine ammonia-lyase, iron-sulfur-dependent, subunit alpha [Paenibacillus woosongensis]MUG45689.1 L-serine ammonia-lyase, iron-sulfur-dependent, subunit alpha [Paenibacillus woosongensis]